MTSDLYQTEPAGVFRTRFPGILEIQPGMNVTSVEVIGGGGAGGTGSFGDTGPGSGGGGGAYARKDVSLSPGDKIVWYVGAGGITGVSGGETSSVSLLSNLITALDITGETIPNGSETYKTIAQTFEFPNALSLFGDNDIILYSVSANIYTNSSTIIKAELRSNSPTGPLIATSEKISTQYVSADGSLNVEIFFGSVLINAISTYSINFIREQFSQDSTIFGALSVANTHSGGTRWNGNFSDSFSQVSGEDVSLKITVMDSFNNLLASAKGGQNGADGAGAIGGAGGQGLGTLGSVGDVGFAGGNGANAQSGGGSRGGSGGGAGATSSGAGQNGVIGSGGTGGLGGSGNNIAEGQANTIGGEGADAITEFDSNRQSPGVGGGGGGGSNVGVLSGNGGRAGGDGAFIINYNGTRNKSDSQMFNIFSPI
jgi:hypothetical protein